MLLHHLCLAAFLLSAEALRQTEERSAAIEILGKISPVHGLRIAGLTGPQQRGPEIITNWNRPEGRFSVRQDIFQVAPVNRQPDPIRSNEARPNYRSSDSFWVPLRGIPFPFTIRLSRTTRFRLAGVEAAAVMGVTWAWVNSSSFPK